MGFSPEVRNLALVAAARHCCVCHKYKGVKVEVHHIIHSNAGGSDDLDNAIALCFDCHADAGHYNPKHPRGTRFSPQELRVHRDTWHRLVREHKINLPDHQDTLYCRYLLCRNFEAFCEISQGDFSNIPFASCMLYQNSVFHFHKSLIQAHSYNYRHTDLHGDSFKSREEYLKAHPESIPTSNITHPYFKAFRIPTESEVRQRICPVDSITGFLVEAGATISEITKVYAYIGECEGYHIQESYKLRPLWTAYLAATNISNLYITPKSIQASVWNTNTVKYRTLVGFNDPNEQRVTIALPNISVAPQTTIIILLATLLGPLEDWNFSYWSSNESTVSTGQRQEIFHVSFEGENSDVGSIGPAIWPTGIQFESMGLNQLQEIHEFDLKNLYLLNRYWEAGCCPHLFFGDSHAKTLKFAQELFSHSPGKNCRHTIMVPDYANTIVIAELEREVTYINEISENGLVIAKNLKLKFGEIFQQKVSKGATLFISGQYQPDKNLRIYINDPWQKNELIVRFLEQKVLIFK